MTVFRGLFVAFTLLGIIVLAGCGGTQTDVQLSKAKVSVVEGLPVPEQALLLNKEKRGSTLGAHYVVSARLDDLNRWYSERLPSGQPWHGWTWYVPVGAHCLNLFHSAGKTWQWQEGGSSLVLTTLPISSGGSEIEMNVLPEFSCQTGTFGT